MVPPLCPFSLSLVPVASSCEVSPQTACPVEGGDKGCHLERNSSSFPLLDYSFFWGQWKAPGISPNPGFPLASRGTTDEEKGGSHVGKDVFVLG